MKRLFLVLPIIFSTACSQDSSKSKINEPSNLDLKISDDTNIYGTWTMCASFGNGSLTTANVCPKVVFSYNGTGHVEKNESSANPFSGEEMFRWNLRKGYLKIFSQGRNSTFPDTNYYAKFDEQKATIKLTISQGDVSYYLEKGIAE